VVRTPIHPFLPPAGTLPHPAAVGWHRGVILRRPPRRGRAAPRSRSRSSC